jgi:hypothetical protein
MRTEGTTRVSEIPFLNTNARLTDVLALELDGMVPSGTVEDGSLEELASGEVGDLRLGERSSGGDEDVAGLDGELSSASVLDVERPETRLVRPGRVDNESLEADVADVELALHSVQVCDSSSAESYTR